jgi:hypothetical protein
MMKIRKLIPVLGFLTLVFAALACNLPFKTSPTTSNIVATLAPPPTSEFFLDESSSDPTFFVEEFDQGIPEDWISTPGWSVLNSILSTENADAFLEIPGKWQDLSLFSRLKFSSDGFSVQFNQSESGSYSITISQESIRLDWQPAKGDPESLSVIQKTIDSDWHDLVLRQTNGKLEVILDGEPTLKQFDLGLSPAGSITLSKTGSGKLEIDRIVMAPAGMGPGSAAPTPGPVISSLDLALVEVSIDENGQLVVWLINNGPDSTQGHTLSLMITIAPDEPALSIIGDPLLVLMDVEWVNLFPVETGIVVDSLYSAQPLIIHFQPLDFNDPDPSNNQLEQLVPELP